MHFESHVATRFNGNTQEMIVAVFGQTNPLKLPVPPCENENFKLKLYPDKGLGLVAKKFIPKFTTISTEEPMMHIELVDATFTNMDRILTAFKKLSANDREHFLTMSRNESLTNEVYDSLMDYGYNHRHDPRRSSISHKQYCKLMDETFGPKNLVTAIMYSTFMTNVSPNNCLYRLNPHLNHDCAANCKWSANSKNIMAITTLDDVEEGEELTVPYCQFEGPAMWDLLHGHYRFICSCPAVCREPKRRSQIFARQARIIRLYNDLRFLGDRFGHRWNQNHSDQVQAVVPANKGPLAAQVDLALGAQNFWSKLDELDKLIIEDIRQLPQPGAAYQRIYKLVVSLLEIADKFAEDDEFAFWTNWDRRHVYMHAFRWSHPPENIGCLEHVATKLHGLHEDPTDEDLDEGWRKADVEEDECAGDD